MLYKNYSESNSENKMMSFANRSNYYIPFFPFTSTIFVFRIAGYEGFISDII